MKTDAKPCLIVQSDYSILLEKASPFFEEARDFLLTFSQLVKCPEHIHTYKITSLSLWNAAALGLTVEQVLSKLESYAKYPVSAVVIQSIKRDMSLYGVVQIVGDAGTEDVSLIVHNEQCLPYLKQCKKGAFFIDWDNIKKEGDSVALPLKLEGRGLVKVELMHQGIPVQDLAGYSTGSRFPFAYAKDFNLRDYQIAAADAYYDSRRAHNNSGILCLPCGAGKTIIGIGVMHKLQTHTLVLTPNTISAKQWREEILSKTDIATDSLGLYTGQEKEIRPITIATYQILTKRKNKQEPFTHFSLFYQRDWGLIIYDEVHVLPAEVFQVTSNVQSRRRLGLTATLVREDDKEGDVFSLIGPKKYDMPWKTLEEKGWIAKADCIEVGISMGEELAAEYFAEESKIKKFRIATENPAKIPVLEKLLKEHSGKKILIIGMYLNQIQHIAQYFSLEIIEGKTPQKKREEIYARYRGGELDILVLSKVGNFAVDLPDAQIAIEVSGMFGSRQEEAQRLGRILRPKAESDNSATFYSLVTTGTREEDFALNRKLFLLEQGYDYHYINSRELADAA